jgi:hypothetical protein
MMDVDVRHVHAEEATSFHLQVKSCVCFRSLTIQSNSAAPTRRSHHPKRQSYLFDAALLLELSPHGTKCIRNFPDGSMKLHRFEDVRHDVLC